MPKADLNSSDDVLLGKYNRYTFLYTKTGKTSAENTELAGLQTQLADYLITASEWNSATNKAPLDSPVFTGTPTAPTATAGTNSTQIATTAFITNSILNMKRSRLMGGMV